MQTTLFFTKLSEAFKKIRTMGRQTAPFCKDTSLYRGLFKCHLWLSSKLTYFYTITYIQENSTFSGVNPYVSLREIFYKSTKEIVHVS